MGLITIYKIVIVGSLIGIAWGLIKLYMMKREEAQKAAAQ